ncbi:hypothetical protein F5Y17DRAFT_446235 [Xylariaceae sp. FL0594]|nr:hypothetical protein F5Y17DRAFT_446235 [Xylariaceae sp. FL0594]
MANCEQLANDLPPDTEPELVYTVVDLSLTDSSGRKSSESLKSESVTTQPSEIDFPVTVFHRDASHRVIVAGPNGDSVVYKVCVSTLACVSPVWKKNMDAKENNTLELVDDAEAIRTIFHIAHHNYCEVPVEPTLNQLFEIAKTACRYQCTHLFYPWAAIWVSRLFAFVGEDDCFDECHKSLYVAWTFGELVLFRDMLDALVVSSKTNEDGSIVNIRGDHLKDMHMPPGAVDIITKARASTIEKILDGVRKPLYTIANRDGNENNSYCKVGKDGRACELIMLGSAIAELTKAGLFPVPEAGSYKGSISDLKESLLKVKAVPYCGRDWMPHLSHDHCTLGLDLVVRSCLENMEVPIEHYMMSWMFKQSQKCGIKADDELKAWKENQDRTSGPDEEQCGSEE